MSQVIRINDDLYNRLKFHAEGFDTPANVIEKTLAAYEAAGSKFIPTENTITPAIKLEISFNGLTKECFKEELLKRKFAYVTLFITNNTEITTRWNAPNFSSASNLDNNLRSGPLRNWKTKGIYKAALAFNTSNAL